ncbi:MAG: replicative DNA helicase [Anaerovoracaceae bacterium]
MERIPPHNIEAEKSVLGAAMLSKDALLDVLEEVRAKDFYSSAHKEIFEVMDILNKANSPVDVLTVSEELKKRNVLELVGGRGYIATLSSGVPSTANAKEYAKIVGEKATLRRLIESANQISDKGYDGDSDAIAILDFAEKEIFEIAQGKQHNDLAKISDVLIRNLEILGERQKQSGGITGVTSGLVDVDRKLSGFQKSDMIVLAARPSMGKTAFALNVGLQAALRDNATVLIFSLEMSKEQLGQRLLAMEARVDSMKMNTGEIDGQDWEKISTALDSLGKSKIMIDDTPGLRMMEIKNKCRRLKAEQGLDMIIVDYLQLMDGEGRSDNRQQEITQLSRGMKQLAREMDCPVIVLSQLSRAVEQRPDHRPVMSDLRESGAIEQDADVVIFLYRDEVYHPEDTEKPGVCEVMISKHRNGPTGVVDVLWQSQYTRFANLSR